MFRFIALLLGVMVTAMSVPAPAMTMAMARQDMAMSDCGPMSAEHRDSGLPMSSDCQKCCLAMLALPMAVAQPLPIPIVLKKSCASALVPHLATPEPPPPRPA